MALGIPKAASAASLTIPAPAPPAQAQGISLPQVRTWRLAIRNTAAAPPVTTHAGTPTWSL